VAFSRREWRGLRQSTWRPEAATTNDIKGTTMRYMLLCYDDEKFWQESGEDVHRQAMEEAVGITHELDARGQYILASPRDASSTATSVRVRDGKQIVTDGPFVETREVLGGFYLIDVKDLNEALSVAARHPGARLGGVEVRPLMEIPGLPKSNLGGPLQSALDSA